MAFVSRWRASQDEPKGPFVLNKDHPQARGLVFWMPCHPAFGTDDVRSRAFDRSLYHRHGVHQTNSAMAFGRFNDGTSGLHLDSGNPDILNFNSDYRINLDSDAITLMARFNTDLTGSTRTIFGVPANASHSSPFYKYALAIRSSNQFMPMMATDVDGFTRALGGTVSGGTDYHFAATWDTAGEVQRNYVDGDEIATTAMTGSLISSTQPLRVGANASGSEAWDGILAEIRVHDVAFSPAEIGDPEDPKVRWALYYELSRRIHFDLGGSGVDIAAPAKAFTLTGQVPAAGAGVDVQPPAKSYSLSGQVPAVGTGANVSPPAGSFVLSGLAPAAVGPTVNVRPPVKAFSLTGQVPAAGAGVLVSSPAKSFSVTGFVPTITAGGINIAPPTFSYTLQGQAPSVGTGVNVFVPVKNFVLTGLDAFIGIIKASFERLARVLAEDRTIHVPKVADDAALRTVGIDAEDRTAAVPPDDRTYKIPFAGS